MATQVNSLAGGGGTPLTGVIGIVSTSGALTVGQNTTAPANNITVGYNPTGITAFSAGGQPANGNITLATGDGLSYTNDTFGTITLNTFSPATGTATTATMTAQNLGSALAWAGSTASPPISTVAYVPGAVVIYSSTTYVCLVAQAIGSALPVNGADWQSIGGGGGGTPTEIQQAGASVAVGAGGGITSTTTGTDDYIVNTKTGTATGNIILSGNGSNTFGTANINIMNNAPSTINMATGAGALVLSGGSGSTLTLDNEGSLLFTTTDVPSNANLISLTTTIPTTTPAGGAGNITINSAGAINITSVGDTDFGSAGAITATSGGDNTLKSTGGQIVLDADTAVQMSSATDDINMSAGGATLVASNAGDLTFLTTDIASNTNKITMTTTIPTTTPGVDAGHITITAGGSLSLSTGATTGNLDIANPGGTVQVSLGSTSYLNVDCATAPPVGTTYAQGIIPFYNISSVWSANSGYIKGHIVSLGTLTAPTAFYICILTVLPVASPAVNPSPATPGNSNWLPFGGGGSSPSGSAMTLSTASGAVWSGTLGYAVGEVVNQPSPAGIFVCIQTVPAPTPPSLNPTPITQPAYWVELLGATTSPGSAMLYSYPFNGALAYPAQSVVPDPGGGDFVCILATTAPTPPTVNPDPSADPTHWQRLGGTIDMVLEGDWANAGVSPYVAPPVPLITYQPQETVLTPNIPPTGLLYPNVWVSGTSYLARAKVQYATSATVATLTNWLCIVATGASTQAPYDLPASWVDVGAVPISNGLYPWGGGTFVNKTASSGYPLTLGLADFSNIGWNNRQIPDAYFTPGKFVFPPLPSANIQVAWQPTDSAVPKCITGLCPYSPQFFSTWLQPIRVNVAFDFEQQDATGTGATDEIYLTVGLYGTNTLTLPTLDPLPTANIVQGMMTTTMITQQTFTYYQGVFPGWTNLSFEAEVGEYFPSSTAPTFQYYGLYAILEFNAGLYTIACDPEVDTYKGNAYWQFSPRLATATNNNYVNN